MKGTKKLSVWGKVATLAVFALGLGTIHAQAADVFVATPLVSIGPADSVMCTINNMGNSSIAVTEYFRDMNHNLISGGTYTLPAHSAGSDMSTQLSGFYFCTFKFTGPDTMVRASMVVYNASYEPIVVVPAY